MGRYIDSNNGYATFKSLYYSDYFVDKSSIIHELNKLLNNPLNCICITKPRRFGKSAIVALIISYYSISRKDEFKKIFDTLEISGNKITNHKKLSNVLNNPNNKNTKLEGDEECEINKNTDLKSFEAPTISGDEIDKIKKEYINTQGQYHTIYIDFSEGIKKYSNIYDYLSSLEKKILNELKQNFGNYEIDEEIDELIDYLYFLNNNNNQQFIFVIDEWDCIFSEEIFTVEERKYYLTYLKDLLKGKPYVLFAYMTGIYPIAKSTAGTSLNNFVEFSMLKDTTFYKYFGLTEKEVRNLCKKNGKLKYEEMENWYDGYRSYNGEKIFNTWSVMIALVYNSIDNYWTESGSKKEIEKIIDFTIDGVKEELIKLIVKKKVHLKLQGYGAENAIENTSVNENQKQINSSQNGIIKINKEKNEMYSKMVVLGLLTYYKEEIFIPNNELREKFIDLINENNDFIEYQKLMKISKKLYEDTLERKTDDVCQALKQFHMDHTPLKNYYSHIALSSTIYFAYYYARNKYYVMPEEEAGDGVADYIFKPKEGNDEIAIIIEIKVGTSARDAINQIYDKEYYNELFKFGYKGKILLVGINILKGKKTYTCIIEYFDKKKIKKTNKNNSSSSNKRKRKQNQTEYQKEYKKKLRSYNK